jgi:hypothetical protein
MKETHIKLKESEIVHHINWDYTDFSETNLIVIPKLIHELIHEYLGYVTRDEINTLVNHFNASKNLRSVPTSFLNLKLSRLVNTNKDCELSLSCKNKLGVLPKKEKKEKRVNHKKLYESIHGKVKNGWDVHHIDWNRENNDINNLIAIPKKLHQLTHKYWGYVDREEYERLLIEFPKLPSTASISYLSFHLSKFVNKRKTSDLAKRCKSNMEVSILRYRAAFDWRDGKNGLS